MRSCWRLTGCRSHYARKVGVELESVEKTAQSPLLALRDFQKAMGEKGELFLEELRSPWRQWKD